ncbi:hypothetical protein H112_08072 [Trichophyton rubrum D6]|uniref:Uncharacterized protein n=3 Tax=Trichophyton TaxID=5550 RepID=A0A080WGM8_TRIRC|nr:uncharacterized protein TERG_11608 [Trichophyton rubrum CBS 118892]EZF10709.1 hypothetical protein H100_08100 [Trichophyton rubrum MR850]EZF37581.1 hypothetical protein H102_08056 [Trichophyton rubrum CBS 100081]EZF48149.1 hypothetical protein H103_08082 [Trichophyton rubrum CBS 288.86]EZF58871.1 hypothetical protein H104_08030 [Trichophyton rubrum CBS 289.86]EZF69404.1 hypothetical protein H105_08082 [Trichophyton soudanense CBS 452.61]EZF80151.1 hypothetical protein H110_08083 [Trichophy
MPIMPIPPLILAIRSRISIRRLISGSISSSSCSSLSSSSEPLAPGASPWVGLRALDSGDFSSTSSLLVEVSLASSVSPAAELSASLVSLVSSLAGGKTGVRCLG